MLAMILSAVTSRLAGPVALAGCAVLGVMLIGAKMEAGGLRKDNASLERAIHDPVTGWDARLTACKGNVERLDGALKAQGAAVTALKAESAQRSAEAAKALTAARSATTAANRRVGAILAAKPGADMCASADDLILGSLTP